MGDEENEWQPMFTVGELVDVQARTWPGINKQGGVGRITAIGNGTYTVKYLLGGRETGVEEIYISSKGDDTDKRKRKAVELFQPEDIPIYTARTEPRAPASPKPARKQQHRSVGEECATSPVKTAKPKSTKKPLGERQAYMTEPSSPEIDEETKARMMEERRLIKEITERQQSALEVQAASSTTQAVDPRLEELKERVTLQLVDSLRITECAAVSALLTQFPDVSEEELLGVIEMLQSENRVLLVQDEGESMVYAI